MYTRIIFQDHTGSNNSKVQGVALTLKAWEQERCLDVFCYKAIVMFACKYVCLKKSKQMFQGHVSVIMSILMSFFWFLLKLLCFYVCFC